MSYKHHKANYHLGERELRPEERIVVGTREGPEEPRMVAERLGISVKQPKILIDHKVYADGEYLPTFTTKNCLEVAELFRYRENYERDGQIVWGEGLRGRTVYIVDTFSKALSALDLDKRVEFIAHTAKYCGAEAVVLIAHTLRHSAQERGVHQKSHSRMLSEDAKKKYDGQSIISMLQLQQYMTAGIDAIITPHNHCPEDTENLCQAVNKEFFPMFRKSEGKNSTLRYHLDFFNVDLAPMLGVYLADQGKKMEGYDFSGSGKNVAFVCVDKGVFDNRFVHRIRKYSGLENAALVAFDKVKSPDNKNIEVFKLIHSEKLSTERGLEGMCIIAPDDAIRSGGTMRKMMQVLKGVSVEGCERDPLLVGTPSKVLVYATRTNFASGSIDVLSSSVIDDILITNSDPRGYRSFGELDVKTKMILINYILAEAAKAVESGINPNSILTPDFIRKNKLMKIKTPDGHKSLVDVVGDGLL